MSVSIKQALLSSTQKLVTETSLLDAELLLCHVLGKNRAYLRTWPERELSAKQSEQFEQLLERRSKGEPIAYILGCQEFWSLSLRVTPATLIPRPETELLVELALEKLQPIERALIADLGTGSGAIALAIASEMPMANVIATDFSREAIRVAQENASELKLPNVEFINSSWLDGFAPNSFDMIVSNPPYIERGDPDLDTAVKTHEPDVALYAERAGLADIENIVDQSFAILKPGGWLLLEHGWKQSVEVKSIFSKNGFEKIQTLKDLAGHDRVTMACKGSE